MGLTRRCNSMSNSNSKSAATGDDGFGLLRLKSTRSFGRKRILVSDFEDFLFPIDADLILNSQFNKRFCNFQPDNKSPIESLPQDILIRILCGVDHDDLKRLFHVSTVIREAARDAEKLHFAYSTPRKTRAFRSPVDFSEEIDEEIEAPNAPKLERKYNSRLNGKKKLAEISVQLFASPKTGLFMEEETE